ncbi:MAG: flavin reductase [Bacteroidetes bacterium]|jgi:flavin reductase (DIM6/NTAB) family NADH-FMN oxidoreductase RutF|nr:flavin reductase [Bacteroidota bacterium]
MLTIDPKEIPVPQLHQYLLGAVGPRPICFASTVDAAGNHNLAPFSFFNVFAAKPPIAIFSPNISGKTGLAKDTHLNVLEVPECVINIVNFNMVHQMSLTSSPYPKGISEFTKAGFTPIASDLVKPMRVKESPVQLECKVFEVKEIGNCNLVMCEIVKIHISESVLNEHKLIDQQKIDLVARMGGNWYCRAHGDALFEIEKPITTIGIGVDTIPGTIKNSPVLTGNNLGQLGNIEVLPTKEEIETYNKSLSQTFASENEKHQYAKTLLEVNKVKEAWCVLLAN